MRGNLPWVAAALVVVAIVGVLGWALYPAAPAPAPASTYENNATYWMATWTPGVGWAGTVEYQKRFDMVWATRGETPQMARVCRENLKVEYNLIGDFVYLENSTDAMEVVFENENYYGTNGFLRVNAIFDNGANGWIMRAGESWSFNVGLWLWT